MISREQKQELFEQIEQAGRNEVDLEGAILTRTVVITEWAVPGEGAPKALYHLSSDANGNDIKTWEAVGMLAPTLTKVLG